MSVWILGLGTLLGACGQHGGQPCFENNDCSGPLVCCVPSTANNGRGTCEGSCNPTPPPPDSGMMDMPTNDALMDQGPADTGLDMTPADMTPADMTPADTGMTDT
jgi:hypothetical protein